MSKGDICIVFGIMLFAGIGTYIYGLGQYSLKRMIEYTPTSKAVAVAPGIAELKGIARQFGGTYISPYGKKECVYYHTELHKWSGSGKHRHRYLVGHWESERPFCLEDDTGSVLIKPELHSAGSEMKLIVKTDLSHKLVPGGGLLGFLDKKVPNEPLRLFLESHAKDLLNYNDLVEVHETVFENGDELYVLGSASAYEPYKDKADADDIFFEGAPKPSATLPIQEGFQMLISHDKKRKFFAMSEKSEKDTLSEVGLAAIIYTYGGPLLFLTGYLLLLWRFSLLQLPFEALGVLVAFAMYSWVFLSGLLALSTSLVALKNAVERASANIDVMLRKRAELIPELIEVVKGYARHEQNMFEGIAFERAESMVHGRELIAAIAEKYPDLKANENFSQLFGELARVEGQIAASRSYCNECIMLYNTQIARIPYVIVAKFAGMKQIQYFGGRQMP